MEENILEKIYKSVLKFLVPLNPEETYRIIVEEAKKLVNAEYGSIFLLQQDELVRTYSTLPSLAEIKPRKKGWVYRSFKNSNSFILDIKQIAKIHPQLKQLGIKSVVFIPLSYRKEPIGVLTLQALKPEYFSGKELRVLELFGSMASLAIRKTQLYDESIKALESRDLFISMAAHELRTPITTIHGYIQLLFNKIGIEDTSEARWSKELMSESNRLTLLVNDLLEISRIKSGKLHYILQECNLKEVLKRAVRTFQLNYPQRNILFEDKINEKPDIVIGDFNRLLQVINNLFENAIKFSDVKSPIVVYLNSKSHYFTISIKDQGRGIDKKDLPKIFEGYYRGKDNVTEGMGLGLFLAKNIIEQHHGTIHIHSKINKGTLVEIQLPKVKI